MAKKAVSKEIKARTTGDERDEVISSTTAEIEKKFGAGACGSGAGDSRECD